VVSSYDLVQAARLQTTETGLPQTDLRHSGADWFAGYDGGGAGAALRERIRVVLFSGLGIVVLAAIGYMKLSLMADPASAAAGLMLICFALGILAGVPIAFTLGLSAMVFFICDPSLPFVFFSQQVAAGVDHFVLLAIPFFLLAGAAMEINGMSTRLVELIVRGMGRSRRPQHDHRAVDGLLLRDLRLQAGRCCGGWRRADAGGRRAKQDGEEAAGCSPPRP
jgi:hypothetical protein